MDFISKAGLKSPLYFVIIKKVLRNGGEQYEIITKCKSGGGHSQLTCGEKAVSQVLYGNVITHLLRNLEYVIKRSRTMCAMTGLNILPSLLWESVSEGQESGLLQRKMSLFNDSKESRYDIESSCKTQVAGAAATLPKRTYSPIHLFSYSLHKKAAFTLAEVLITLGIIGVVAAMTMPSLIANHQRKVLETAFKKSYANLYNAVNLTIAEDGVPNMEKDFIAYKDNEFYVSVYNKLSTIKVLPNNYYQTKVNIKGYTKKPIKGATPTQSQGYITHILADGSAVGGMKNSGGWYFTVDTNGPTKGPNAYGHDIFIFVIKSTYSPRLEALTGELAHKTDDEGNSFSPDDDVYYESSKECSRTSTKLSNGFGCTPYAVKNLCPDDNSKTYWECLP